MQLYDLDGDSELDTVKIMGRPNGQVMWFDSDGAFNVMAMLRREQVPLTPEQYESGASRPELNIEIQYDIASHAKIAQAVAGFTSTYTIMEDNRIIYHGSNDFMEILRALVLTQRRIGLASFDVSTHTGIGAGVDDALNMSWWFDHKNATTSINPSWAGLTPIRLPLTLNGSGFWDKKTYDTDNVLDKFQNSWPNYWFSSGALNGEPFISLTISTNTALPPIPS